MKSKLHFTTLITTGALALASFARAAELTVTISDFRNTKGVLLLSLVDSEVGWNNQVKPVAEEKLVVADKVTDNKRLQVKFTLPPGKYAVQVMHDENDNGKMDLNFMGIPKEGHGASNNLVVMRRPNFSEAVFALEDTPTEIVVHLR